MAPPPPRRVQSGRISRARIVPAWLFVIPSRADSTAGTSTAIGTSAASGWCVPLQRPVRRSKSRQGRNCVTKH